MPRTQSIIVALSAAAALALAAGSVSAQNTAPSSPPPDEAVVTLANGDILRGVLVSAPEADPVVIMHAVLGEVRFARSQVSSVRTMSPADAGKATEAAQKAAEKVPPPPPPPDPESFFEGWKGSAGLGLNGASGNTESLSLRGGLNFVRETTKTKSTAGFVYNYATSDGDKSSDNARLDFRHDWLPQGGSKWRPFVQSSLEYDQFQDWDYRFSAAGGVGYEVIKNDKMLLLPRAGIGTSKEIGGSDNKWHLEGLLGVDFEYTIDDRSKFFASADSFWRLDDLPDYRLLLRAGYEIMVDPESNMSLRLGVEDKYDSSPGDGRKRNDLTYFAMLNFNF